MTVQQYDPIDALHANITDALNELREARLVYEHAPTVGNARTVKTCETRMDDLLNQQKREEAET